MPEPNWKVKTIRLKGRAYKEFREALCNRANSCCENCGRYVPLYYNGEFDEFLCGNIHHLKTRGAGGQDLETEVAYLCFSCHRGIHDGNITYREPNDC